jgi:hypothetical protein
MGLIQTRTYFTNYNMLDYSTILPSPSYKFQKQPSTLSRQGRPAVNPD